MKFGKSLLFALIISLLLTSFVSAAFVKTRDYTPGTFNDVPEDQWYASEVKSTYELGLMGGKGDGVFDPSGNVTVAEAITMASRAAALYAGEEIPAASSGEWYQMYVDYAKAKGFVADGQFDVFSRPAKRFEVAKLFENAMPDGYFTAKNDVSKIPDVSKKLPYQSELITLYKAGVVMGSDSYGNFRPEDNIIRAEAAAIINRVALPQNRLSKTLDKYPDDDAYTLVYNTDMVGWKEGINSGWRLDNRGSVPKTALKGSYGTLTDIDTAFGSAMIREFNKFSTGVVSFEGLVQASGERFNGVIVEFRNDADKPVYKLVAEDNSWKITGADGSKTTVFANAAEVGTFTLRITIDLDNCRSKTVINKVDCGTHPLLVTGADANLLNFRYATGEKETPSLSMGTVRMTVNYATNDDFDLEKDGTIPYGWQGHNAINDNGTLKVTSGYATKTFNPVSGTVIANTEFILDKKQNVSFSVKSGSKNIVNFTSDNTSFYANGVKLYDYVQNLWYRIRIEAKTAENKAVIWLNGRRIGEVDFAEKTTSIDNIAVVNSSADTVQFDNINVFEKKYHEDYVPVPVKPAGEEKYTVGLNVCSLWRNGTHYGWSCISAYDDPEPVLGYYDEGLPETADWEIKYLIEHGIDFQAFCWYADKSNAPLKAPNYASHLYDGFMYAEYADMTKYCLLWEAANASKPKTVDDFKKYYAPYFIENFFKDPRYMVIDNKPLFSVFGQSSLASTLGGNAKVKECFDYLEEEVKKLGFDGIIFDCCGVASAANAAMGFDTVHAYGWGNAGSSVSHNKSSITTSAKNDVMFTIPTISVGFNSIPWHNIRYPLMTVADYREAHQWVKDTYFTTYPEKGTWEENFVWLSTWNEYGEGTYIMPSKGNGGFGYIDVIRELYTDEKIDESLNAVPTAEQKSRINHMFPQYRKLLRNTGYYKDDVLEKELTPVAKIDYSDETSKSVIHTKVYEYSAEGLKGMVDGDTHVIASGFAVDVNDIKYLKVTLDVPKGVSCNIFFTTTTDRSWNEAKKKAFTAEDGLKEYIIDMSTVKAWSGVVNGLRIDPGEVKAGTGDPVANRFHIVSVEFMREPDISPKAMLIDGNSFEMQFSYEKASNGDVLVAFDPEKAMDYRLNCFHTWDAANKRLTLEFRDHTVVYTVGSSTYTVDGVSKNLGYELYTVDGLPMIPIQKLCDEIGFECSFDENGTAVISTDLKPYYDKISNRVVGQWEFDNFGDTENWSSTFMQLSVWDGAMTAVSTSTSTDPTILLGNALNVPAAKYNKFEIKVRYKYPGTSPHGLTIYFTTDKVTAMNEDCTIRTRLKSCDSNGEWEVYTVDLTKVASWKNTIKSIRLDPFSAPGTMEFDYIRFIEDENYDPAKVAEKEKQEAIAAGDVTIYNGDAEGKDGHKFFSDNTVITIVKDPENENNHCYFVNAKNDKENWHYFRQKVTYIPGATYSVSYDVKIHGRGVDLASDDSLNTQIVYNAVYGGSLEAKTDHIIKSVNVKKSEGWKHIEFQFTVPETSDDRNKDQFAVFANPVEKVGITFYIDNIKIEEIKSDDSRMITNGDAEGTGGHKFFSDNTNISIVSDPDKADNKCYLVAAKNNKENWHYFRHKVTYKPGATYKGSYDIKLNGLGADMESDETLATQIVYNAVYSVDGETKTDHIIKSVQIKKSDGWKHVEFQFTIPENSLTRSADQFAVFANPVNKVGTTFYIDNIVLELVAE